MTRIPLILAVHAAALAALLAVCGEYEPARWCAAAALILGGWVFAWATIPERIDDVVEPPVGGRHE